MIMQREIDPAYMEFVMDALHMQTDKVLIAKKRTSYAFLLLTNRYCLQN
jgi:hypothetical protein